MKQRLPNTDLQNRLANWSAPRLGVGDAQGKTRDYDEAIRVGRCSQGRADTSHTGMTLREEDVLQEEKQKGCVAVDVRRRTVR